MPIDQLHQLRKRLSAAVLGAEEASNLLLTALLAKGHALIEGAPGVGKTSLAQTLANGIGGTFKRIQFTPDLLPSDILGYHLYKQHNGEFEFVLELILPVTEIFAGLFCNQLRYGNNKTGFFSNGDKGTRIYQAELRVVPADERLKTHE